MEYTVRSQESTIEKMKDQNNLDQEEIRLLQSQVQQEHKKSASERMRRISVSAVDQLRLRNMLNGTMLNR